LVQPIDRIPPVARTDIVEKPKKPPPKGDSLSGHHQPPRNEAKKKKRDSVGLSDEATAALAEIQNAQRESR